MNTYETYEVLIGFLNISVIIFLAYHGFNEWKKEQIYKEAHEIAKGLFQNILMLKKKIDFVRSPAMFAR